MSRLIFTAVKKPSGSRLQGINIQYGTDTPMHFRPASVSAGEVVAPDKFMSSVNDFFANFGDDDHATLAKIYKTINDVREAPRVTHDDIFALDDAMEQLFGIVTLERIQAWGRDNNKYVKAASLGNIAPMRDGSVSYSCNETEYLDICILSTLFKILIPFQEVSSHIHDYLPDKVVEHWSLFSLLNSAGMIEEYPAYQQLIAKAAAMAESHLGKGVPTGLTTKGIGEEDFYRIILIPKLFRDITRLETEVEVLSNGANNNISYKINKAIENHIKHDIKGNYRFNTTQGNNPHDDDTGNTTRQEAKAGGERISSIYGMFYTHDYENFLETINNSDDMCPALKIPNEEVEELVGQYPRRTTIHEAQETIAGAVFHDVIPMDAAQYRPAATSAIMLAYTACIAKKLNLPNIYTLMTSAVDEDSQLTESESRNAVLKSPIVHPDLDKVLDTYVEESNGNPFIICIDNLMPKIVRSNFTVVIKQDGYQLGEEYYPRIINDMGIKDELVILFAHLNGVYDE